MKRRIHSSSAGALRCSPLTSFGFRILEVTVFRLSAAVGFGVYRLYGCFEDHLMVPIREVQHSRFQPGLDRFSGGFLRARYLQDNGTL